MTGVNHSLSWTPSDAVAEVVSAESCHIVLEISPPDYVEKISRYLESSVGQSRRDKVCNEPAEADSDSGDSLFITQKPASRPVRSGRRRRCSLRSDPTSPRDPEESEDDASSSASHGESKTDKERRRKKYRRPKYSFPFLAERGWKPRSTLLPVPQNISLHNSAMGGFFNCVRELWQSHRRGDDAESSLPTVDMDGDISPLSEEEEGRPEDEDIKVVERKRFVVPSKAKRQQTWCSQLNQQRRRKASNARQETSVRSQRKTLRTIPAKAPISRVTPLSLDTEISDDGESSCRVLAEREKDDAQVTSERHFLAQTETPNAKRRLSRGNKKVPFQQKAGEEELCEPRKLQRSPGQHTQKGGKASTTVTEPQSDVFHTDDLSQTGPAEDEPESPHLLRSLPDLMSDTNNDSVCNETRLKKRKKKKKDKGDHESVEEGQDQSREEPEGLRTVASVNVEVEETPSLSEDNQPEPLAWQTGDELHSNGKKRIVNSSHDDNVLRREERDTPDSTKKKRKKDKTTAENVGQEVDGNLQSDVRMEDSVFSVSCNVEKKKKRKRRGEGVEQLQSSTVAEPLNDDDAEIKRKKKKRKKEKRLVVTDEREEEEASNRTADLQPVSTGQLEESGNCLENTAVSQETLESSHVKRKKHKKKRPLSSNVGEEEPVTPAKSTEMSLTKKKKKKKTISDRVDISSSTEENEKVENTQKTKEGLEDQNAELVTKKKKKKKKTSAVSNRNVSEDTVAQSDDLVSVQEKEKKRTSSFLVADAEEKDAQTHGEQQHSPSRSVDAHVWGAQTPGVGAGDCETESAEIAGNLEGSDHGLRKRKKKRKRRTSVAQDGVEKDQEPDFEEPSETCRRKKKRKGNESESATPMERLESAEDAAVVLKEKKKGKDRTRHVIQESPLTTTGDIESERSTLKSCSSDSHRKKGKRLTLPVVAEGQHGPRAEMSHDSSTSDQGAKETMNMVEHAPPSSGAPGNQALNDIRVNKKKKKKKMKCTDNVLLEGKSLTKCAEFEPRERKKQSAAPSIVSSSPGLSETLSNPDMSSSDSIMKNKHIKAKRRLHNPCEDFLTDC